MSLKLLVYSLKESNKDLIIITNLPLRGAFYPSFQIFRRNPEDSVQPQIEIFFSGIFQPALRLELSLPLFLFPHETFCFYYYFLLRKQPLNPSLCFLRCMMFLKFIIFPTNCTIFRLSAL